LKIFAIDPSTTSCGWASIDDKKFSGCGVITQSGPDSFERCSAIAKDIYYLVSLYTPDKVICEYPHKGGPGMRAKTITILFHLCGMLHAYMDRIDVEIEFVTPMQWKGNQPKEIHHPKLIKRVQRLFKMDISDYSGDTIDALGLGIWEIWDRK